MQFIHTKIPDIIICKPTVHSDDRGYFMETFRHDLFEKFLGYPINFCQDNESQSNKGVLRGLHYQLPPHAQTKLVRVIYGSIYDVAVDIRHGSPTFGQYMSIELSATNKNQLLIPKGFAHGFVILEDHTVVSYKVDHRYSPEADRGIAFDDPELAIDWQLPKTALHLSEKDTAHPPLKDYSNVFNYSNA
jgi:dTDP-4-dehydrorhamnose 3,5-epimerase